MNPNPSSSYFCSTRALIFILLQFLCDAPLPPNSGKIPKRLIFSTIVFFNFPTNSLYLCTILVLPSVYALFVPTCTNIDHPWPFPNVFSTRSVTGSIQAPVRQTTKYSPLLKVLSVFRNNGTAYKYPFCSQWPLNQSISSVLHLPGRWLFPCHFLCCSFLSCLFSSCHHPCYWLPFRHTYSHFLSSLHLSFCPVYLSPFLSHSTTTCSTVTFSPVTFLHVMFSVVLSPFVFFAIALHYVSLISSSFLPLHCSSDLSSCHRSPFHLSLWSFSSPSPSQFR